MYVASGPVSGFIDRHPTTRMLALAFLLMIGVALVADGVGFHIPRGYLYAAMAFSAVVEILNVVAKTQSGKARGAQACAALAPGPVLNLGNPGVFATDAGTASMTPAADARIDDSSPPRHGGLLHPGVPVRELASAHPRRSGGDRDRAGRPCRRARRHVDRHLPRPAVRRRPDRTADAAEDDHDRLRLLLHRDRAAGLVVERAEPVRGAVPDRPLPSRRRRRDERRGGPHRAARSAAAS